MGYRMAPNWYIGAYVNANNTADYSSQSVGFNVRYLMMQSPSSNNLQINSIPDWKGVQFFRLPYHAPHPGRPRSATCHPQTVYPVPATASAPRPVHAANAFNGQTRRSALPGTCFLGNANAAPASSITFHLAGVPAPD